ncbi:MAG: hypothetical protein HKN22_04235 [Bacteroidia bacterium]|nr:hypothetical protein [Bacteroidia bacterium]
MRRVTRSSQKLTNKPTAFIVASSILSLIICSVMLWIYLSNKPTESKAIESKQFTPTLDFEIENFTAIDSLNLRVANYREVRPIKKRKHISKDE